MHPSIHLGAGAIAERSTFHAYVCYSFFMSIWVYPLVAHWIWAPAGWLSAHNSNAILGSGAIDFSGSGGSNTPRCEVW
jgi:Amt family ammonium transporter